uniref:Apple domain-containing protein n=1 Tax=Romanomermis culicivorax TaxID=13658 RepID=A0A915L3A8_ROMCU
VHSKNIKPDSISGIIKSLEQWETSSNGGIQSDCDYQGMDISNEITDTVKMCKEKCSNDILCTHFTWVPNWKFQQNMCFLKYASTKDEATKSLKINLGTQCGLINAKFEDLWVKGVSFRHNCYYAGQDVDQKRSLTVQQCLLQCSRMSNCTHITWSRNVSSKDAICYFKYAAGGIAWYRETDNDLDKCGTFVTKIDMANFFLQKLESWKFIIITSFDKMFIITMLICLLVVTDSWTQNFVGAEECVQSACDRYCRAKGCRRGGDCEYRTNSCICYDCWLDK